MREGRVLRSKAWDRYYLRSRQGVLPHTKYVRPPAAGGSPHRATSTAASTRSPSCLTAGDVQEGPAGLMASQDWWSDFAGYRTYSLKSVKKITVHARAPSRLIGGKGGLPAQGLNRMGSGIGGGSGQLESIEGPRRCSGAVPGWTSPNRHRCGNSLTKRSRRDSLHRVEVS
jgi:hypothetical protein